MAKLSKDFQYFDWENQFGNATYTQLQTSYDALVNKKRTNLFSLVVWNDIVELLYKALTEAGYKWLSDYGTYEETKMSTTSCDLSAKRFNAVCLNLEQVYGDSWKWSVLPSFEGYLNRIRVFGASQVGEENADYVYASYILEIARVLNVLIAILKDEAEFKEVSVQPDIHISAYLQAHSLSTVPIVARSNVKLFQNVKVVALDTLPITPNANVKLSANIKAVQLPTVPTDVNAEIQLNHYVGPVALKALLINVHPTIRIYDRISVDRLPTAHGSAKGRVNIFQKIETRTAKALPVALKNIINVHSKIAINSAESVSAEKIQKNINLLSKLEADVIPATPTKTFGNISLFHRVEVNAVKPIYTSINNVLHFFNNVKLDTIPTIPALIRNGIRFFAYCKAEVVPVKAVGIRVNIKLDQRVKVQLNDTWLWPIQNGTDLYIRQVYSSEEFNGELFIDCEAWEYPTKEDTNLHITQVFDTYQSNDDLSIDRFIEPIRSGSNLHIVQLYNVDEVGKE